jgi:glycosyltransferase involved in cell wall biosynthesis
MSHGLPCLAHDYGITRYVLGEGGYFADFTIPGRLTRLMVQVLSEDRNAEVQSKRHRAVFERFAWERLRPLYVRMIQKCAGEACE